VDRLKPNAGWAATARVPGVDLEGHLADCAITVIQSCPGSRRSAAAGLAPRAVDLFASVHLRGDAGQIAEVLAAMWRLIRLKAPVMCRTPSMPASTVAMGSANSTQTL